jgi:hypothetical protein
MATGKVARMKKYEVYATLKSELMTVIEADSLEEAQKIADEELITSDFDQLSGEFTLGPVIENEEKSNAIVWKSQVTKEMVAKLSDKEIETLNDLLDQAVQEVCESYEVNA